MKLYLKTRARNHLMFVTPGNDSDASDWKNPDGTLRNFTVRFIDGVADVPGNLGDYLIAKGVAQSVRPALPAIVRPQDIVPEPRVRNHRMLTSG